MNKSVKKDGEASKLASISNPVNNDRVRRSWRTVALGLLLKIAAAWVGVIGLVFLIDSGTRISAFRLIGCAVSLDYVGRILCDFAPIEKRSALRVSILFQTASVVLMAIVLFADQVAALALTTPVIVTSVAILLAAMTQAVAASYFTGFLGDVACAVRRPDLEEQVQLLRESLNSSISTISKLGLVIILACVVGLFLIVYLWCFGLLLIYPLAAITLLPASVITLSVLRAMLFTYNSTVRKIRAAVVEAASGQGASHESSSTNAE